MDPLPGRSLVPANREAFQRWQPEALSQSIFDWTRQQINLPFRKQAYEADVRLNRIARWFLLSGDTTLYLRIATGSLRALLFSPIYAASPLAVLIFYMGCWVAQISNGSVGWHPFTFLSEPMIQNGAAFGTTIFGEAGTSACSDCELCDIGDPSADSAA